MLVYVKQLKILCEILSLMTIWFVQKLKGLSKKLGQKKIFFKKLKL